MTREWRYKARPAVDLEVEDEEVKEQWTRPARTAKAKSDVHWSSRESSPLMLPETREFMSGSKASRGGVLLANHSL